MPRHHSSFEVGDRFRHPWLPLILIAVLSSCGAEASEPSTQNAIYPIRGGFKIGKEGRLIYLPVVVNGSTYRFLMDTGACRTAFDIKFREILGQTQGVQTLRTPAGYTRVETYHWPKASIAGQILKSDREVACIDFSELRRATNELIYGVIGMDVLRHCCIQIDFDHGVANFRQAVSGRPEELGERIPIQFSADGAPYVDGTIDDTFSEHFLIDAGAQGNSLRSELFDELVDRKLIRLGGSFASMTVGGEVQGQRGNLDNLSVGTISYDGLRFARVNISSLGLRFFSRFQTTFDFPNGALYLKKGPGFSKPEPRATSGMTLNWIDGKIVVISAKTGSAAAEVGIRSNDILLRVNERPVSEFDHFSLRQLLTSEPGRKVAVKLLRGTSELDVVMTLVED